MNRRAFISRLKNKTVVFIHDILMIPIAWLGAYWLRFNLDNIPINILHHALANLPLVMIIQIPFYWIFGLYRGIWQFASMPDLVRIVKAVAVATLLTVLGLFFYTRLIDIPRSVFPLYSLLLIMFLGGSRFVYRWLKDHGKKLVGERVLIVGAGQAGEGIIRDLSRNQIKKYSPVAIVDDDTKKLGKEIHGVRVVGRCEAIPEIVEKYGIELIIIAMPSAGSASMRHVVEYCEQTHIPFRTLPGIHDLASGSVKIDSLREVLLEDLLGRDPVSLDWKSISKGIENATILISGGGGSIGSELCRQIAKLSPKKMIVIEQNEFNLYSLRLELMQTFPELNFFGYLADVTDQLAVKNIFKTHTIDMVFHAAAYKHVPMLETQVRVAMCNNILGTQIMAEKAISANVKKFVLISTDKAVNPTNVMGATKRAAEILCQYYNGRSSTQFITVRFGNVLGSAGSVVPLFRKQIEQGGPVTVTHPEITRFFMTIPEAAQLILQATVIGSGGEIFVLDMGEPINIRYLAEQMIMLSGRIPNQDIEIVYTGLRSGEKLYEELFYATEELVATGHEKILRARRQNIDSEKIADLLNAIMQACNQTDENKLQELLFEFVPEYLPANSNACQIQHKIQKALK